MVTTEILLIDFNSMLCYYPKICLPALPSGRQNPGLLEKKVPLADVLNVWGWSWIGNFIGSVGLAALTALSGVMASKADFVAKAASTKMLALVNELFFRGLLCNWLVCLAIWTSIRTKSDAAKCILIFWCLFAFIACGFEYSVANMTLLPHPETVTWIGAWKNLFVVSLSNIVGGAVCVGFLYWLSCRGKTKEASL